jgi:hypothetical protein
LRSNVQKAFGEGPASFREALRTRINSPDALIQTLADLRDAAPADAGEAAARVRRVAVVVSRLAGRRLAMLQEALKPRLLASRTGRRFMTSSRSFSAGVL